eukprot:TRINITY_DN3537_c0_g1_i2.p1 TRINITY_DN3537_c0_g1~~TRINITY_DN3537_c0_g1_i2.p1  ORF type:complete len:219 (+),score=94.41 TRINITY_DN3537_c0_g1_i2:93-749(+)
MSNWDDEDFEAQIPGEKKEEPKVVNLAEEKIVEEEIKAEKPKSQPKNTDNQKNKLVIKNKNALNGPRKQHPEEKEVENETKEQKNLRLRKLQIKGELDIFEDTFGDRNAKPKDLNEILTSVPESQEDFKLLAESLSSKLSQYYTDYHYVGFVSNLLKGLASNLNSTEISEISKSLSVISNEKINQEKDKKPKKKKAAKKFNREIVEDGMIEDEYDMFI